MSTQKIPENWGQKYHTGIKEHYEWHCPGCENAPCTPDDLVSNKNGWFNFIIGFSKEIPGGSIRSGSHRGNSQVIGSVIMEYPHCFEKYFIHVTRESVTLAMNHCPKWPKGK